MTSDSNDEKAKADKELSEVILSERLRWRKLCAIPPRYANATFGNFEKKKQLAAFEFMSSYDWHLGKSVVLSSPRTFGVGKTHLVCALLHKIIATEDVAKLRESKVSLDVGGVCQEIVDYRVVSLSCPLYFVTETELMARIRATFTPDPYETEEKVFDQLKTCGLLVIDDVGKVKPRDPNFLQGTYYRIIDGRYGNLKPVILTTNLNIAQLEEHMGGACGDRLVQMCDGNFIQMAGKSYREMA